MKSDRISRLTRCGTSEPGSRHSHAEVDRLATRHAQVKRDEEGSTLILALVFLIAIGLIVVSLGSTTSNNLGNSSNLSTLRSLEYAADGAASLAVQNVRYSGNPYSLPPTVTNCLPGGTPSVTINGQAMSVYCTQYLYNPTSSITRQIIFYACSLASAPCNSSNSVLEAQVRFNDFAIAPPPQNSLYKCTVGGPTSTCGSAMTIISWVVKKAND